MFKLLKHGSDTDRVRALRAWLGKNAGGRLMTGGSPVGFWTPQRRFFFTSVMLTTLVQLGITFATLLYLPRAPSGALLMAALLGYIALFLLLIFVPMPVTVKMCLYTCASVCLGAVLRRATAYLPAGLVQVALLSTIAVFSVLLAAGIMLAAAGYDLSGAGMLLCAALMAVIITQLVDRLMAAAPRKSKTLATICLIIFSMFVVYDTNIMLRKDYAGDVVTASLEYYLDFVNIFNDVIAVTSK